MQTKLTLRLDKELIQRAKSLSKRTGKSISQIVTDYFSMLEKEPSAHDFPLTPTVQSLKGTLRGVEVSIEDYRHYLEDKYL